MKNDPVISRIRAARHRISEECGHDPKKLVAYYMERQKRLREKEPKASDTPSGPLSTVSTEEKHAK